MSFFSSLYSKIFKKEPIPTIYSPITDSEIYQVKLEDIRQLIGVDNNGNYVIRPIHLDVQNKTINSQLKILYSYHTLLLYDEQQVVQAVSDWIDNGDLKPKPKPQTIYLTTQPAINKLRKQQLNHTQTLPNDQTTKYQMQVENSMYVNYGEQQSKFAHSLELEQDLLEFYYNYIQRLSWGIDVLQSSRVKLYPYPPEAFIDNKQKFLWLYKIINLLNYQTSGIQLIKFNLQHTSVSTPLIKDIATQILEDCVIEYEFLSSEITEMIESISSMHVSDGTQFILVQALQFYEVYQIIQQQTKMLKDYYGQRDRFQPKHTKQYEILWFKLSKQQKVDVEDYIFKIKFLHTGSFRKSLNIPSKNVALEALRSQLIEYQSDPKGLKIKNKQQNIAFVSTKNTNEVKFKFNKESLLSTRYKHKTEPFRADKQTNFQTTQVITEEIKDDNQKLNKLDQFTKKHDTSFQEIEPDEQVIQSDEINKDIAEILVEKDCHSQDGDPKLENQFQENNTGEHK